ncbi:MAG: DNA topoisomerase, partial [Candidatus Hodarchaeota archaeon]
TIVPPSHHFFKDKQNYWKIYEILIRRYLLQYLKPAKVLTSDYTLRLDNGLEISITLLKVIEEGIYKYQKPLDIEIFADDFNLFTSIEIDGFFKKKCKNDPSYYTNATLLKEIKRLDLGSTVSFLLMIDKLVDNDYIQTVNNNLKLTKRGEFITNYLDDTFDFLGSVEFSRFFIDSIHKLMKFGTPEALEAGMQDMKEKILRTYLNHFDTSRENTAQLLATAGIEIPYYENKVIVQSSKSRFPAISKYRIFCSCGSPMLVIETKNNKRFLACENRVECGKTAFLPNEGRIEIAEKMCKLCGKHIMKIDSKVKGIYFYCPTCWTKSIQEPKYKAGFCSTCKELDACWLCEDDKLNSAEMKEVLEKRKQVFQKCPRCKNHDLFLYMNEDDPKDKARLICENPLCNYHVYIPEPFIGKIEKSGKKCMVCPMNAVIFTKNENNSYHVCLNCYNSYLHDKEKEIGFCIGCKFYKACFKEELESLDEKLSIKESIKKKMEEIDSP